MNIVIAGASGGIGRYLTDHFDKIFHHLDLTYNTRRDCLAAPTHAKYSYHHVDFTVEKEVAAFYKKINRPDIVINAFGWVANGLVTKLDISDWDYGIARNLTATFLSCKHAIGVMEGYTRIINLSSVLGSTGMVGATAYATAKGGVEAFTRSFALEAIRSHVFVNALALGYFKTGMGLELPSKIVDIVKAKIPAGDFGDASEIGNAIDFLVDSEYIVGQTIHLNGGLYLT